MIMAIEPPEPEDEEHNSEGLTSVCLFCGMHKPYEAGDAPCCAAAAQWRAKAEAHEGTEEDLVALFMKEIGAEEVPVPETKWYRPSGPTCSALVGLPTEGLTACPNAPTDWRSMDPPFGFCDEHKDEQRTRAPGGTTCCFARDVTTKEDRAKGSISIMVFYYPYGMPDTTCPTCGKAIEPADRSAKPGAIVRCTNGGHTWRLPQR